jgi:hypothetical protein
MTLDPRTSDLTRRELLASGAALSAGLLVAPAAPVCAGGGARPLAPVRRRTFRAVYWALADASGVPVGAAESDRAVVAFAGRYCRLDAGARAGVDALLDCVDEPGCRGRFAAMRRDDALAYLRHRARDHAAYPGTRRSRSALVLALAPMVPASPRRRDARWDHGADLLAT